MHQTPLAGRNSLHRKPVGNAHVFGSHLASVCAACYFRTLIGPQTSTDPLKELANHPGFEK